MKTFGFTARYFPLPQPTSTPTEPSGRPVRKRSTSGHGYSTDQHGRGSRDSSSFVVKVKKKARRVRGEGPMTGCRRRTPCISSRKSGTQSGRRRDEHDSFHTPRCRGPALWGPWLRSMRPCNRCRLIVRWHCSTSLLLETAGLTGAWHVQCRDPQFVIRNSSTIRVIRGIGGIRGITVSVVSGVRYQLIWVLGGGWPNCRAAALAEFLSF